MSKDEMVYNGTILQWAGHGSYKATSGAQAYQKPQHEDRKGEGPIPEGEYEVPLKLGGEAGVLSVGPFVDVQYDRANAIQSMPREIPINGKITPIDLHVWGCHRVRLKKIRIKNPKCADRDGFYIHDSTKGGTAGCIETEELFFEQLIQFATEQQSRTAGVKNLTLIVDYSEQRKLADGGTTNGGTHQRKLPPVGTPGNADRGY